MKNQPYLSILMHFLVFFFSIKTHSFAIQKETSSISTIKADTVFKYAVAIKFQSVCCGVPSDVPLQKAIKSFKSKNKIKVIDAVRIGPLGREGEYDICFQMNEMNARQKKAFIKIIKTTVKKLKNRGKAVMELNATYDTAALPSRIQFDPVGF